MPEHVWEADAARRGFRREGAAHVWEADAARRGFRREGAAHVWEADAARRGFPREGPEYVWEADAARREPDHEYHREAAEGRPPGEGDEALAPPGPLEAVAGSVFGDQLPLARRYAEHLVTSGVERGLIGPREAPRIWDRHILNCAVVAELVPNSARVVDVGSGAGLPGIPLALARPDLSIVLVEPLARRVEWLCEIISDLGMAVEVERGRAEENVVRRRWEGADVVTSRAVAPLARLAGWSVPLLRPGGLMLAMKGASAVEEIERDSAAVRKLGGGAPRIERAGAGVIDPPSTVVVVERVRGAGSSDRSRRRRGQA